MECWNLIIGIFGIIATATISVLIRRWQNNRTREIVEFMVNLVTNSAGDPTTVRRLLADYNKTGVWRGTVSREGNSFHVDWRP